MADPNADVAVNEVAFEFDGWGNVSASRQAHAGTVVTDGQNPSPRVQYGYADGASGGAGRFVRLDSVIFPGGGRTIRYIAFRKSNGRTITRMVMAVSRHE